MAIKKRRIRSSWSKGKKTAHGYYVRRNMTGPRRFRLREVKSGLKHDFDSPQAAKTAGWEVASGRS